MIVEKTVFEGVYIINNFFTNDERGLFVKTFNQSAFNEIDISLEIKESYYSISQKNVIRGMHFQLPPYDHEKLVSVPLGGILDVVVDLRKNSSTYKKHLSVELTAHNKKSLFIPKGLAHGFKSLVNDTMTLYNVSTEYKEDADSGINYDSIGFNWQLKNPIISTRDKTFPDLHSFCCCNPF